MGNEWAKNFFVGGLSEEEKQSIPYPAVELGTHVTFKTTQVGCLTGYGIVSPLYRILQRNAGDVDRVIRHSRKLGFRTAALGFLLGPAVTWARINMLDLDVSQLKDRCFRLRHNEKQLCIDRASLIGGVVGAAVKRTHGFVFFVTWAVAGTVLFNMFLWDKAVAYRRSKKLAEKPNDAE